MKTNSLKNPAPIASEHKPDFAKASAPAPEKGKLMKKKGAQSADPSLGSVYHRSNGLERSGARYGITVNMPSGTSPEAGATQSNGRIIPAAVNRSRANFSSGMAE